MEVKLKHVRLSFPQIFTPKEFTAGDGKPRFDATFLIVPGSANDKAIREAIKTEATNVFAKKADGFLKQWEGNSGKFCYLDGNNSEYDGYSGHMSLACHTKTRPLVLDKDKTPLTEADGKPYAGCYVNAIVSIYAQQGQYPGIRASFSGIQFAADGDAFSGSAPASVDDFDDLSTEDEDASNLV